HTRWPRDWSSDVCSSDLWLKERDPNCGHDHLLHNTRGRPATVPRLQVRLKSILLRQSQYRINPWGLESFSFHRLRHFMASSLSRSEERRVGKEGRTRLEP